MKLTVIPTGGLGNRMLAVAAGYNLAKISNRELEIIWQKDAGLNAAFDDIFEFNKSWFELKEINKIKYDLIYELPRKKNFFLPKFIHLFDSRKWLYHYGDKAELMDDDYFENICISQNKNVVVMSCYPFYKFTNQQVRNLFTPSKAVANRVGEILKNNNLEVAIQIRRTDNKWSIENSPVKLFEEAVDKEIKGNPHGKIYLATDDQNIKNYFSKKYGDLIVYNPKKAERDSLSGIIDAVAEMEIMSKCRRIYGSYSSTYSVVASYLGDTDLIVVKK